MNPTTYNNNKNNKNRNRTNINNANTTLTLWERTTQVVDEYNVGYYLILCVILAILVYLIYWYYYSYSYGYDSHYNRTRDHNVGTTNKLVTTILDGKTQTVVANSDIPTYASEYTISMWLTIADYKYRYGTPKTLISRGRALLVYLDATTNDLICKVKLNTKRPVPSDGNGPREMFANTDLHSNISGNTIDYKVAPIWLDSSDATYKDTLILPQNQRQCIEAFNNATPDAIIANMAMAICDSGLPTSALSVDFGGIATLRSIFRELDEAMPTTTDIVLANTKLVDLGCQITAIPPTTPPTANDIYTALLANYTLTTASTTTTTSGVTTTTMANASASVSVYDDANYGVCVFRDIPLQKWQQVTITMHEQSLNIYQNATLVSSCVLAGYPELANEDLTIAPDGGFDGSITGIAFANLALTQDQILALYDETAGSRYADQSSVTIPGWLYYTLLTIGFLLVVYLLYSAYALY